MSNFFLANGSLAADGRERIDKTVGIVLGASRKNLSVSQTELADRLGWSRNQVVNVETGRKSVRVADFVMMAKALNIDPVALLHRVLRW